jgi:uncharacterized RDD family membrane protein YckC
MADSLTGITFRYAGFWLRFVAVLIDTAVVLIVMWILGLVFGVNFASLEPTEAELNNIRLFEAAAIFIAWIYYAVMESTAPQATVGKLFMGIYVTDLNGNRVSFGRASLRYWAKVISSLILLIGYVMAAFTRQKQALHDIIASCLVLKR